MSKELKIKVEKLSKELENLIRARDYNMLDKDVLKYSQKLDVLIAQYMKNLY